MHHCSKCGIPKVGNIRFNDIDVCHICQNWDDYRLRIQGDFSAISESIRERGLGKPFDCIVGISGGRDSTYTLYKLVKDYDLRCAAVFVENAFTPTETSHNVKRVTEQLNVRLFQHKIPSDYHIDISKKMISFWQKSHDPLFSNLACAPCKLFNKFIFELANGMKVNSIVYGGNPYEFFYVGPGDTSKSRSGKFTFNAMLWDSFSKIIRGAALILSNIGIVRYLPIIIKASLLYCNQYAPYLKLRYHQITPYDFFHYYDWDETEMNSILKKLGWMMPEGCVSTWRADCEFEEVKNYMFMQSVGISHIHSLYSNLARENKISREDSISRSDEEAFSAARLKLALEKLSLASLEKSDIMD
jgi:tRNA(Ile)-lysidine synthase TilS/MesJ